MRVLVDTSVLIDWERDAGRIGLVVRPDSVDYFVSVVTVSELLVGTHRGDPAKRGKRQRFTAWAFSVCTVLDIDHEIARLHARLAGEMFALGRPPGLHDLWIAATAIHHDLQVLTRDTHSFPFIPGVRLAVVP